MKRYGSPWSAQPGPPAPESTFAVVNIIRRAPFLVAGGPEPRKIRQEIHRSIRASSRVMMRVGGPYVKSPGF
jgi:hypothetical protein